MSEAIRPLLALLAGGARLTDEQAETTFDLILQGDCTPSQVGAVLASLRARGESVDEIIGAVRSVRAHMERITAPAGAIDTCGTGGDGLHTYNVSTAVAFVVAGCGVPVVKHGNRASSSRCGAADVLEALGVNLHATPAAIERSMQHSDLGFIYAPRHHGAMRHVAASRRELGFRTIFNLLGPLCNPANVRQQLLGVFAAEWLMPMAEVLRALGCARAWVVHGEDGMDELTTTTASQVVELRNDGGIRRFTVEPEQAGIARCLPGDLVGGDASDNAAALRALLHGQVGPYRDIVLLNAAAALLVAGRAKELRPAVALAAAAIDSGAAAARLEALLRVSNEMPA